MPTSSPSQARSTDTVAPIKVKFDGSDLSPEHGNKLVECVVKKVRVLPDMAHVVLADPVQSFVDGAIAKLGSTLEIAVGGPSARAAVSLFKGEVTAIEPEFRDDGVFIGIRAYDKSHAMTRGKHTRVFQDKTAGDMVENVASSYFDSFSVQGDTGSPFPYMMQSNESDWDFAWRIAGLIGFELVTSGTDGIFRKIGESDGAGPWLQYGMSEAGHRLFSFRPRLSRANLPEKIVGKYVNAQGVVVVAEATVASGVIHNREQSFEESRFGKVTLGKGDYALGTRTAENEAEMRRQVEAARDRIVATAAEAEGVAEGHPDLRPGMTVDIRAVGRWSGNYLLSECVHVYRGAAGFRTRFHVAGRPKSLLSAVSPHDVQPAGDSQFGIVQAEVTNTNDPDSLGRIRVKLPTMTQDTDPEGWWARIATSSAGKERGLLMLPQVGDKVIVGFENGDTRKPFILGAVWDGKSQPGEDIVQQDGSFSLKSDSKILMKSAKEMDFQTDKGWKSKANNEVMLENGGSDAFTIKSGKEIVLDAPTIKLKGGMKIEIGAPQIEVSGTASLKLNAPQITIGGGMVKLG
jgi:phage protein D/phage baseplate assembly protein gpV